VSFKNQIMPTLQVGKGGCAETKSCHGGGVPPKITTDANETYTSLAAWTGTGNTNYINPCVKDKTKGAFAANLRGDQGAGTKMPLPPGLPLAQADIDNIDKWQADGAPNN
jgi:hypothetical protein